MKPLAVIAIPFALVILALVWANHVGDPLPREARADLIVVKKAERTLSLYTKGVMLRSYSVSLGLKPIGAKGQEGDNRTPEGRYTIDWRKADSQFHRALHVSYPSRADKQRALERRVSPGGDIMVHGLRNGFAWLGRTHLLFDWTRGCIALTNAEIEEIWRAVPDGTPIEVRP